MKHVRTMRYATDLRVSFEAETDRAAELAAGTFERLIEEMTPGSLDAVASCRKVERVSAAAPLPINMLLFCPVCHTQHVDAPEPCQMDEAGPDGRCVSCGSETILRVCPQGWQNPPHKSHRCSNPACKDPGTGQRTIWRPADVETNGVKFILTRGDADNWAGEPRPAI